jgi:hypothetical protein
MSDLQSNPASAKTDETRKQLHKAAVIDSMPSQKLAEVETVRRFIADLMSNAMSMWHRVDKQGTANGCGYDSFPKYDNDDLRRLEELVERKSVVLEATQEHFDDHGRRVMVVSALVANRAYEKDVTVRASCNDWRTYHEIRGDWIDSVTPRVDRFRMTWRVPTHGTLSDRGLQTQFAIRYTTQSRTVWDNNDNSNYAFALGLKMPSTYMLQLPSSDMCE